VHLVPHNGTSRTILGAGGEKLGAEERVKGIEPSSPAWKAGALPLSYTRIASAERSVSAPEWDVGAGGFEPPTSCSQSRRPAKLGHAPLMGSSTGRCSMARGAGQSSHEHNPSWCDRQEIHTHKSEGWSS
jgi:hypothetical protein